MVLANDFDWIPEHKWNCDEVEKKLLVCVWEDREELGRSGEIWRKEQNKVLKINTLNCISFLTKLLAGMSFIIISFS